MVFFLAMKPRIFFFFFFLKIQFFRTVGNVIQQKKSVALFYTQVSEPTVWKKLARVSLMGLSKDLTWCSAKTPSQFGM